MFKISNKLKSLINPAWNSPRSRSKINLLTTFSSFKPHGNQSYEKFVPLVIKNINELIPTIAKVAEFNEKSEKILYSNFYEERKNSNSDSIQNVLAKNLNKYGSDKVSNNYHLIYSCIFTDLNDEYKILEVGLGSNNRQIISSMGVNGNPGASIKAFRDSLPNSLVYGADIDKEILFEEERIKTFQVDQNNPESFNNITKDVNHKFNLIIDDGLHYQLSNLNTLIFALNNLEEKGFLIIEDIGTWTIETWEIIYHLLPSEFEPTIIQLTEESGFVFLIQKIK